MKRLFVITGILAVGGCMSTEYPVFKNEKFNDFVAIEATKAASTKTKNSVSITDLGKVSEQIVPPVQVQACDGMKLLIKEVIRNGKPAYEEVMEVVNPFDGMHVRRVMIKNDTNHTITLGTVDAILVDPNGNDHEMSNRDSLERYINSKRPCSSTRAITASFDSVPFLANQIKVRPGRNKEVFAPFANKRDLAIKGEWSFQLLDFPTRTDASGAVSRRASFVFPIEIEQTSTTVRYQKDGLFSPWVEIDRNTTTIE